MANIVHNTLQIECKDEKKLAEIKDLMLVRRENSKYDFVKGETYIYMENLIPIPEGKSCSDLWGTKCIYSGVRVVEQDNPNRFVIEYDTAWSPNNIYMVKLFIDYLDGVVDEAIYNYYSFESNFGGRWSWNKESGEETQQDYDSLLEYYKDHNQENYEKWKKFTQEPEPYKVYSFNKTE